MRGIEVFIASCSLFLSQDGRCNSKRQRCGVFRITGSTLTEGTVDKYNKMLDWLRDQDDAYISSKIELKPSTLGGGFGAFLSDTVEENELLFRLPRSSCITMQDAFNDPQFGESFKKLVEKAGPGGNTVVLAGFIAKERLRSCEQDAGDSFESKYGPYLATLPWNRYVNNQEHILFWNDDEIESLLTGTMCYSEAVDLRREVAFAKTVLETIFSRPKSNFKFPWERDVVPTVPIEKLPEAVIGAFVCLLTRAFQDSYSDDDNSDEEKLVPLLDMLQHSEEPNVAHVMLKEKNGDVEVRARRRLEAGDELLNQYRSEMEEGMPYHRFFTRFGFVPGIDEPIIDLLRDKSSIFIAQKAEV